MWNVKGSGQRQTNSALYRTELSSTPFSVASKRSCGCAVCSALFCAFGPTADCCCPKHQPHCGTAGMARSPPTERHQPGTGVCHLPPETGGHPCPRLLHCSPGLSQVFNRGRRRMERSRSCSGEAGTPSGSRGCFPLEERRTRVTTCRQQPKVSGIKLPSKTPGPQKILTSGL